MNVAPEFVIVCVCVWGGGGSMIHQMSLSRRLMMTSVWASVATQKSNCVQLALEKLYLSSAKRESLFDDEAQKDDVHYEKVPHALRCLGTVTRVVRMQRSAGMMPMSASPTVETSWSKLAGETIWSRNNEFINTLKQSCNKWICHRLIVTHGIRRTTQKDPQCLSINGCVLRCAIELYHYAGRSHESVCVCVSGGGNKSRVRKYRIF